MMKLIPATFTPEQRKKRITTIVIVVILALSLTVGILIFYAGKNKGKSQNNINVSSPLTPDGTAPVASDAEIRILGQKLHDDMDGTNFWGHDIGSWDSFLALSDSDVVKLNDFFNGKYQVQSKQTFKQWVTNEYAGSDDWSGLKPAILARLTKLNIT